jgi:hypothetical protein|tara:strand:+ start:2317 stop:2553 length:237 start_codon:yes stop_codon:yes gene_type:complete
VGATFLKKGVDAVVRIVVHLPYDELFEIEGMKTKYGDIPISFRPTIRVMELIKERVKKSGKTMTKVIEECIEKVLGNG